MTRRSGRRPGKQDTRETILGAARDAFAEHGYDRATVRQIATSAGVDPALVHHYFGSKEKLFAATISFPLDPEEILGPAFASGPDGAGERLVRTFVSIWDSPVGAAAVALFRSAISTPLAARLLREFLVTQLMRRGLPRLGIDQQEVPLRGALVASQIAGLAIARYILKFEPLAAAPPETVVAAIGPTIQRYLTGPLPAATDGGVAGDAVSRGEVKP